ncbi:MAG: ParB/Srx family N-terminal domain-containing protein [Gammaproteobacteria bacterium]|nr:ParB/Srx family N-terminal domain-containing protein [Gammaproteobacteria bacterium]
MATTVSTPEFEGLAVIYRPITALTPYTNNPRTHSKHQIRQIADSIQQFGFTNPLLIDGNNGVIAGHGRLEAAKLLGIESIPTIRLDHMSEAQKRAYILADNKLAENAGWDKDLLTIELQYLDVLDLDFEITVTGFETGEIDVLLAGTDPQQPDAADAVQPPDPDTIPVTRPGDLWQIGQHRLLCGDATQTDSFEQLMDGHQAQLVFIDPPYNVPIDGHVCGLGQIKHREFAMAVGEMSSAEFTGFLQSVFKQLVTHAIDGAIHYVCMDWRHIGEGIGRS